VDGALLRDHPGVRRGGPPKLADAVYSLWNTTVDGRTVQYPEQLTALPLSVDRDADPDIYDYAIEWRFRTSA
jgi:hypothetical protein